MIASALKIDSFIFLTFAPTQFAEFIHFLDDFLVAAPQDVDDVIIVERLDAVAAEMDRRTAPSDRIFDTSSVRQNISERCGDVARHCDSPRVHHNKSSRWARHAALFLGRDGRERYSLR